MKRRNNASNHSLHGSGRIFMAALMVSLGCGAAVAEFVDLPVTIPSDDDYIVVHTADGNVEKILIDSLMDDISFRDGVMRIASKEYNVADVDSVTYLQEDSSVDATVVYVTWNSDEAPTVKCSSPDVSVAVNGADVTITNTNTVSEYTYVLSGSSMNGSLTLVSDYKSTIRLNGLQLQSGLAEALNIKCGKRVNLIVEDDTENTLADATTDNGQKGAVYCKGHLELSGGGTLHLSGNVKHALSSKEYCLIKKSFGKLDIAKAVTDGIHAGQYFRMNGGAISIAGVGGDGIQAEATLAEDYDEELPDGSVLIKDGRIDIANTGEDVSAVQSDANLQIDGGEIGVTMSGAVSKALNSDADVVINGGDISIKNSGTGLTVNNESETSKGINADNDVKIIGGKLCISMTGAGGKGVKADNNLIVGNEGTGDGPMLSVSTSGASFGSSTNTGNTGGWGRPGGWRPGGGGTPGGESGGGSSAKAMKCMGCYYQYGGDIYVETASDGAEGIESKSTTATAMNFNGGNLFMKVYDDCINSAGAINFNGANVICYSTGNDAIDSNYGKTNSIRQTAGVVISFTSKGGAEMGIDADAMNRVTVTGGTLISGGGMQGGSSSTALGTGSTHYKLWSGSVSYTAGKYYSIVCGDNVLTWLMPVSLSSSFNAMASDAFSSSKTHYIYNGTAAPVSSDSAYSFHDSKDGAPRPMLWIKSNIVTGSQSATFTPN